MKSRPPYLVEVDEGSGYYKVGDPRDVLALAQVDARQRVAKDSGIEARVIDRDGRVRNRYRSKHGRVVAW